MDADTLWRKDDELVVIVNTEHEEDAIRWLLETGFTRPGARKDAERASQAPTARSERPAKGEVGDPAGDADQDED